MNKKHLLLTALWGERLDEIFQYTKELAKIMNKDITMLLIHPKKRKFEDLMTAVTFAEASESNTAVELLQTNQNEIIQKNLKDLKEKYNQSGIKVDIVYTENTVYNAIDNFLRKNEHIEMVLLSPEITVNSELSARKLKNLIKHACCPIVTMTKK
ncbi:hypothetical protein V4D30_04120 [Thermodesulfovibrio sp. 3907-1M]|uniref:UspA domain-containing protein n=1 Tax=Thermodesulfovibrio autotrophicus TaxID=3118333 RepID=A0AAU8GZG4_9BACT